MLTFCLFLLATLAVLTATAQALYSQGADLWEVLKSSSKCLKGFVSHQDDYTSCSELTMVEDVSFTWNPDSDMTILLVGDRLTLSNGSKNTGDAEAPSLLTERAQNICGNEGRQQRDIGDCRARQSIKWPMSAHNCLNAGGKYYSCITFTWTPNSPKNPPIRVPHYHCERIQNWISGEKGECFA
ncbi:hypothetical protein PHSY_001588 [Pseudozyma hubeiensis SY62]|uniref:Uncharacterized protein n=1 Tax=Pseudozyma hubeiensis (strain SY62) TaxID=1305764 RepID=R9NZ41_PSEHS|nr:hypothetical protein PHSY_001588 [Pseudozyma hubeiensis SY62]GAC94019.1 hypothetical protein PHSY_001588 [Pseudozyma hubeiensis SY62]